jgi:hypothetical protein
MIRRHFRRYYKTMLREPSEQLDLVANRQMNYSHDHHMIQMDNEDC